METASEQSWPPSKVTFYPDRTACILPRRAIAFAHVELRFDAECTSGSAQESQEHTPNRHQSRDVQKQGQSHEQMQPYVEAYGDLCL